MPKKAKVNTENVKKPDEKLASSVSSSAIDVKKFNLLKSVKENKLYKISNRDKKARAIIDDYQKNDKSAKTSKNLIVPGQLVLFKYLAPKTLEELEYYDASPCTIFFGIFNSSEGKRVLGFNVHYFPPALRYIIMDKVFEMYKPVYRKYFESGLSRDIDAFDYRYLVDELERHNLSFAVRMYIPSLIGDTCIIPPKLWTDAMFTEGWFKKETRARIMQLYKQDAKKNKKISTGSHDKGKKWKDAHPKKKK